MPNKFSKALIVAVLISISALFPFQANAVAPLVIAAGLALIPLLLGIISAGLSVGIFIKVVGGVHSVSGRLINWGISYQDTLLDLPVIQAVWAILRDFVNIFFILILLVIAFATIFNISNY